MLQGLRFQRTRSRPSPTLPTKAPARAPPRLAKTQAIRHHSPNESKTTKYCRGITKTIPKPLPLFIWFAADLYGSDFKQSQYESIYMEIVI